MNYDYNTPDSFGISILENAPAKELGENMIEKQAIELSVTPGAVIGSLVGLGVFGKRQKELKDRQRISSVQPVHNVPVKKKSQSPSIKGDYYAQADSLARHLKVAFTPVSAIYLVKNGTKDVAIETIDIEKMDDVMRSAWQSKDEAFFKRMLLNKMMMEVNLAERIFARNAIANQNLINQSLARRSGLSKTASFSCDSIDEYLDAILRIRSMYDGSDFAEKIATVLERGADASITVKVGFDGIPEKYASLGRAQEVFSINSSSDSIRNLKKRLENPGYLKKNVEIGFLPDRVTFIVGNTLVTTLSALDMNDDGFSAFRNHDTKYFRKLFQKTLKNNWHQKTAAESVTPNEKVVKVPKATAFRMSAIDPVVYDGILTKRYGKNWSDMDLPAIIKMIEVDFKLNESGIPDIPLNKIMSIYTCLSEDTMNAFLRPLAFEKIIRSFNDMPIDFLRWEREGIGVEEIAYGLQVYDRLMALRGINAYGAFSDEVLQYIAELLYEKDIVAFLPVDSDKTEECMEFYSDINRRILTMLESKNTLDSMDAKFASKEEKSAYDKNLMQNEILQPVTLEALTAIRSGRTDKSMAQEYVSAICEQNEFDINKENMLRRQIQINIDVDEFLHAKNEAFAAQMALYSL